MFGAPSFYFGLIRKYVILTGTLFNQIYTAKTDINGNQISLSRIPIIYGPRDKMFARVMGDPNIDRETATIPLPLISFEMGNMSYDGSRKLPTINKVVKSDSDPNKMRYQYNPVPYNIEFKVYIYAKNAEDAT